MPTTTNNDLRCHHCAIERNDNPDTVFAVLCSGCSEAKHKAAAEIRAATWEDAAKLCGEEGDKWGEMVRVGASEVIRCDSDQRRAAARKLQRKLKAKAAKARGEAPGPVSKPA